MSDERVREGKGRGFEMRTAAERIYTIHATFRAEGERRAGIERGKKGGAAVRAARLELRLFPVRR